MPHNSNTLSYADDMLLLAPTVTALQKLLEGCHSNAGPHGIVYHTTKAVCMLDRPKQSYRAVGTEESGSEMNLAL